jgi:hypothetical protein
MKLFFKNLKFFVAFYVITIIIVYSIIFFWNAKTPITYAQLEYACLNHKGDKSNFVHEVTCNDGQVINNYDLVGNDWIYNRSLEIKDLSFIDHTKYILSK